MGGWGSVPEERDAREEAWAGASWGHAKVSSIFPRSPQGALKGVCSGTTDRVLMLRRSSGFEIRSEEARRDGGSEGQLQALAETQGDKPAVNNV